MDDTKGLEYRVICLGSAAPLLASVVSQRFQEILNFLEYEIE